MTTLEFDLTDPLEESLYNRRLAIEKNDYELYIKQLYKDLGICVRDLEAKAHYAHSQSEDQLSLIIETQLKGMGYKASHDTFHNGHVDIHVQYRHFLWLGEAKIYGSPTKIFEGFLQLTTRYSNSSTDNYHGGLLIYIQDTKLTSIDILNGWKTFVSDEQRKQDHSYEITCSDRTGRNLYFDSTMPHHKSGLEYFIRHMTIDLRHDPQK